MRCLHITGVRVKTFGPMLPGALDLPRPYEDEYMATQGLSGWSHPLPFASYLDGGA